ncbi:hypothetical protein [Catenulispora pinisilvae]|uniref:hypothetical protein n=1 Tax=Catenulispora pinisilvae TaxID=2705253 RepID=UPI0018913C65|nr:hypothetical protein [Catenulispora pinisilvae]
MTTRYGHSFKLAVGVTLLGVLSGCGTATAHPLPNATTPNADPVAVARQNSVAAYKGMWDDMSKAGETANWNDPALGTHATDSALNILVKILKADDSDGAVLKGGPPTMNPTVTSMEPSVNPTVVTLKDCLQSAKWLMYRKSTGALWDDKPGGNRATTAEVVQSQGVWKVVAFSSAALGSC